MSQWKPDIYARTFVPQSLLAINKSPATLLPTPKNEGINFALYIATFAGTSFLRDLDKPTYPKLIGEAPVNAIKDLNPVNYGNHLGDCLVLDLQAQIPEIRSYDLFAVPLEIKDLAQEVYSLHIPGLREGTPAIGLGDAILLRQLVIDPVTSLPQGMDRWLSPGGGADIGLPAPGFTGYEISAAVLGIDRVNERLLLRACGLIGLPICNVSFVVRTRLVQSLQRVVTDIAEELNNDHSIGNVERSLDTNHKPTSKSIRNSDMSSASAELLSDSLQQEIQSLRIASECSGRHWLYRILFPDNSRGVEQKSLPSANFSQKWYDSSLNYEQKKAVDAIQSQLYGELCFLMNGPPGTGKTKTICEIVTQLGKDSTCQGSILLCAPSNPAADTLAMRLRSRFNPSELLRLNDFSRTFAEVPQELLAYCYVQDDIFNLPPISQLMGYRIVIATCRDAEILIQARVTNRDLSSLQKSMHSSLRFTCNNEAVEADILLHWSSLIIDEAAQATEPETLLPLAVVTPHKIHQHQQRPIFAMAGDQHQLNPRTYNRETTLSISLFERLSNHPIYAMHPLARNGLRRAPQSLPMIRPPFVNLVRNYRSHPAILAVPSSLFYDDTLIPEATNVDSLQVWSGWQGRRWPVLFACNGGMDYCEDIRSVGGGWFNFREARKAIAYVQDLINDKSISNQAEICTMSPFRAQVNLLRDIARTKGLRGVNIGPMDAFQGLESRFVIICTTRARKRFLDEDEVRGRGVVNEEKKFNVAITRAKEGLIVIGNPWVLAEDPCWSTFMNFCWRNSLWQAEDGEDVAMQGLQEGKVNDWEPEDNGNPSAKITGLEAALLYKERDQWMGSTAAKRFMGSENHDDAMWREGMEAEEMIGRDC